MRSYIHGVGILVLLLANFGVKGTLAEDVTDDNEVNENQDYERILRAHPAGFSRILRSNEEDDENEEDFEEPEKRGGLAHFSRILRSQPPNTFSRILRGSFSRILKRDPYSRIFKRDPYSRIFKKSGSGNPSFSRILRNESPYERNMRAQHFSRILKKRSFLNGFLGSDLGNEDNDFERYLRSSSFSRIL